MRRIVWTLGVLAVLSVASSTLVALLVPSSQSRASPSRSVASSRHWLRGHGLEVAVPARRWRLEPASVAIRYADASGAPTAVVSAPAVLDVGFCPSSASSSRAFVGLLAPTRGSVREVLARALATWASAIGSARTRLHAVAGSRADLDVPVLPGPCAPTTAHLTLIGRRTPDGVVVLVLVRDVGEPGDLTSADAEEIAGSLRTVGF